MSHRWSEEDLSARGLLCAFRFGAGAPVPLKEPELEPAAGGWTWAHFRLGDVRAQAVLQRSGLPPRALELFHGTETRLHFDQAAGWAFGVLPDLERDLAGQPEGEGRLVFALDGRRLITGRLHALRVVDDLRRQVEAGTSFEDPAAAFVELVEDLLEALGAQMARVEDHILAEPSDAGKTDLSGVRRQVARYRRELQGLRSALVRAQSGRQARRAELLAERLTGVIAFVEDVDREAAGLQERGRLLHEEIDTLINSATNRSMRALTVMSTLLIPPTLIVGAFGMNVPGVPWEHDAGGFAIASGLCVGVIAAAWVMLKRMDLL